MPFERLAVAEVIEQEDARVVDKDVEGLDQGGGRPYLQIVGDVQRQYGDPRVRVGVGRRVPAYTRPAPRRRASVTSACPMPRLAPVTRMAVPSIVVLIGVSSMG